MDGSRIAFYLRSHPHTKKYFRGIFARNELPEELEPASIYIINYSLRREKGTHWILLFLTANGVPVYVDTSGLPPFFEEFKKVLQKYPIFIYSKEQIQGGDSKSCALFVILLALYLSRGRNLFECRSIFSTNWQHNENILAGKFLKEFGYLHGYP
jgi:hypothetical protein